MVANKAEDSQMRNGAETTVERDHETEESFFKCNMPAYCGEGFSEYACARSKELVDSLGHMFKLCDRQEQKNALIDALERCRSSRRPKELVMITGPSGVGKTCLACTLRSQKSSVYFVSMKFDQFQPAFSKPFNILSAFEEYVQLLESDGRIWEMTEKVEKAIEAPERKILADCIPSLARILGSSHGLPDVEQSKRQELQKRFVQNFIKLLRVLPSKNKPLVLFMDDLQWSDAGSLELLSTIFEETTPIPGLLLLGACRGSEVGFNSPLSKMLRQLEDVQGGVVTDIRLTNMKKSAINEMLSDLLILPRPLSLPLAEILYQYTEGNIFILVQFLKNLLSEGILYIDVQSREWMWEEQKIHESLSDTDIVKLLSNKIQQLSLDVQQVLKVAACLGPGIDENLLYSIIEGTDVSDSIVVAIEEGLLTIEEVSRKPKFLHDRMQQAAYSLIASKPEFHETIGKTLLSTVSDCELEANIFLVVNQLRMANLGSQEDRDILAKLCLKAGKKASAKSAFGSAADYFEYGIDLLDSGQCWETNYELSLALYNSAAEAEYVLGSFNRMDVLIDTLLKKARDFSDQLQAHSTRVYSLGARNELQKAIDTGLGVIKKQGIAIPTKINAINITLSVAGVKNKLSKMNDARILDLPLMTDPDSLAAMRMLTLLGCYTLIARQECAPFIAMRQIQLTLKHGMSGMAAIAFCTYGMLQGGAMGDLDTAYQYGQLALAILDKFSAIEWLPRVYVTVYGVIKVYREPIRDSIEPLQFAKMVAFETGDIEFAMFNGNMHCFSMYFAGRPLEEVAEAMEAVHSQELQYGQDAMAAMIGPIYQMVLNFMGVSPDPLILTGRVIDEKNSVEEAIRCKNSTSLLAIHSSRAELAYHMHEYELATDAIRLAKAQLKNVIESYGAVMVYFIEALILLARGRATGMKRRKYKQMARQNYKKIQSMANKGPENWAHKLHLIDAEFLVFDGHMDRAMSYYDNAIRTARRECFTHEEALAYERCGLALQRHGKDAEARRYLDKSLELYQMWGAQIKLSQISKKKDGTDAQHQTLSTSSNSYRS